VELHHGLNDVGPGTTSLGFVEIPFPNEGLSRERLRLLPNPLNPCIGRKVCPVNIQPNLMQLGGIEGSLERDSNFVRSTSNTGQQFTNMVKRLNSHLNTYCQILPQLSAEPITKVAKENSLNSTSRPSAPGRSRRPDGARQKLRVAS
jgi:hypothetical protein